MITLGGISHFYNEELLIPYWFNHHKNLFDELILVDYHSTDNSRAMLEGMCAVQRDRGKNWRVVTTQYDRFQAATNDAEVMYYEAQLETEWKLALNTTEFVWDVKFKETLERLGNSYNYDRLNISAFGMRSFVMVDKAEQEVDDRPLWMHRHNGFWDGGLDWRNVNPTVRRWRYVHKEAHGHYHTGRHGTYLPHINLNGMSLLWMGYSPWPQCKARKLQIKSKMAESDIAARLGFEHLMTSEDLDHKYQEYLNMSYDLREVEDFKSQYDLYCNQYVEGKY